MFVLRDGILTPCIYRKLCIKFYNLKLSKQANLQIHTVLYHALIDHFTFTYYSEILTNHFWFFLIIDKWRELHADS